MHGLPEAPGAASVGHKPILAEVAACPESAGLVISVAAGWSHGEVESVCGFGNALGQHRAEPPRQKDEEGGQQSLGIPYMHESSILENLSGRCNSRMDSVQ
jgi:hypothetical protein